MKEIKINIFYEENEYLLDILIDYLEFFINNK